MHSKSKQSHPASEDRDPYIGALLRLFPSHSLLVNVITMAQ